jgi:hypothetical protein
MNQFLIVLFLAALAASAAALALLPLRTRPVRVERARGR